MEINSPHKKRAKLQNEDKKRSNENESSHSKRIKPDDAEIDEDSHRKKILAMKKKNFITTCKQVSSQAYFDQKARFQLVYTPSCMKGTACKHHLVSRPHRYILLVPTCPVNSYEAIWKYFY